MGIETPSGIWQLNSSWPLASELGDDSDAHHRLTKSAIVATFPNVSATVTTSATAFNHMSGADELTQPKLDAYSASISAVIAELNVVSAQGVSINAVLAGQDASISALNVNFDANVKEVYDGYIDSTGAAIVIPSGWSVSYLGVGRYVIWHFLSLASVGALSVQVTPHTPGTLSILSVANTDLNAFSVSSTGYTAGVAVGLTSHKFWFSGTVL